MILKAVYQIMDNRKVVKEIQLGVFSKKNIGAAYARAYQIIDKDGNGLFPTGKVVFFEINKNLKEQEVK